MAVEAHPCRLERFPSSQQGMYLAGWKKTLPVNKVDDPPKVLPVPVGILISFYSFQK
jgi:hypothetical protein